MVKTFVRRLSRHLNQVCRIQLSQGYSGADQKRIANGLACLYPCFQRCVSECLLDTMAEYCRSRNSGMKARIDWTARSCAKSKQKHVSDHKEILRCLCDACTATPTRCGGNLSHSAAGGRLLLWQESLSGIQDGLSRSPAFMKVC